jgi:spore maturation protein CgeB
LEAIRQGGCRRLIHFSPDNHRILGNQSRHYFQSIPLYDAHITTKTSNIAWLKQCGARRVEWMGKAFDPMIHRPLLLTEPERLRYECDIGFVGHWEPSREKLLLRLQGLGYRLRVWGGGWRRARDSKNPLFADCPHLIGDAYARAIGGAKINLCLLSEWFHDKTTARSVEIPACGKFLLAERNDEHLALFREGVEAEFYANDEEMMKKIDYYLAHGPEREAIARAGRARCLAGYSNQDRLKNVLNRLSETEPS